MSNNPVSRVRLIGSLAIVFVTLLALLAAFFSVGPSGLTWAAIIAVVACGYVVTSFVAHLRYPDAAEAAWDEQNTDAHKASLIFGYWMTLVAFLVFLAFALTDRLDPGVAFFWLGPVLGVVPALHYVVSVMRGRAE